VSARLNRVGPTPKYVVRRVLLAVPSLLGVTFAAFAFSHLAPGDPAKEYLRRTLAGRPPTAAQVAEVRRQLGLDRPLPAQYVAWLGRAARGDLGVSYSTRRSVTTELVGRITGTLVLAIPAGVLVAALAVPAGIVAAAKHDQAPDHVLRAASLVAVCMPSFWLALLLIRVFAVRLSLLPVAGRTGLSSMVLPIVTLAVAPAAVLARFTRAEMLETLDRDYVRTARAKGVHEVTVVCRHALRNALLPLVTAFGLIVGALIAGDVVVETIFAWPGAGRLARDAILTRDYPVIAGFVLFGGVTFLALNLLTDLAYVLIDPRVTVARSPTAS
jgi:peptide/nickel transport system permease protein